MIQKLFCLFFAFLFLCGTPLLAVGASLEFRSGAFFHSSDRYKEIYGTVSPSYQVEAATHLGCSLDGFANFDWTSQYGCSEGLNNKTKISIANFSFGVKYPYQFCERFTVYGGVGPSISRIMIDNHDNNRRHNDRSLKTAVGCILKSGLVYDADCNVFLEVFADYLFQSAKYNFRVNLGGFKVGAGIGYRF